MGRFGFLVASAGLCGLREIACTQGKYGWLKDFHVPRHFVASILLRGMSPVSMGRGGGLVPLRRSHWAVGLARGLPRRVAGECSSYFVLWPKRGAADHFAKVFK